jgi:hypothetical protein
MGRSSVAVTRLALAAGAAASFGLASCSESPSSPSREIAPDAASLSQAPELADETGRHIFHTKQWHALDNAQNNGNGKGKPGNPATSTGISFHGGPVLQSETKVAAIYWGGSTIYSGGPAPGATGSGATDGSLVGTFLRTLGGSPYFNINTTYWNAAGTKIVNKVTYTQFWANPTLPTTASISDAQMAAMLQDAFTTGKLTYDASTVYAIFTGPGVNLGGGFSGQNLQYCAYHFHGTVNVGGSKTVLYAAMPYDYAFPSGCTNGTPSPNGDAAADAIINTLAHEIEEATTDMLGTAWFDNRGYENADKCAWNFGSTYTSGAGVANMKIGTKDYLIQQNWVNAGSGGCAKSYP